MAVMSMMGGAAARRAQFNRDAILSATPVRLLTMLYDRLLLDLNRAEAAQVVENWQIASDNLQHAQAIVSELMSSLKVDAWEGGEGLFAIYTYVSNALMSANIHRDVDRTRESIALLDPLRQTWHEAADQLPAQTTSAQFGGEYGIA
ncbi:flagellar export chaperone FliS [Cryobacterium sp. TmT2-59]|uniref:Flagellar export chaperone FliS n=2 Tax=Microbacteriaceae TaxID=85023 RepID=A0AAQ2C893_9MICO|nr:flagellar export chaperone FliS [Cryobacterium shii]TFC84665.1 flagellar export chaperone FliS [Cryobacterium sp. TmT2-59]TFD16258.1 flagellar export chaperone FliS [Cryobacterium sp. TMT2-23]TFD19062.1 flagellar export chaperone FliS [Cryobacterium sp. TMT4-10]